MGASTTKSRVGSSVPSGANRSKYLANGLKVCDVSILSAARDFVQPAHGRRLQTRFRGIAGGINEFDLDFHRVFAATHPTLPFFPALFHGLTPPDKPSRVSRVWSRYNSASRSLVMSCQAVIARSSHLSSACQAT